MGHRMINKLRTVYSCGQDPDRAGLSAVEPVRSRPQDAGCPVGHVDGDLHSDRNRPVYHFVGDPTDIAVYRNAMCVVVVDHWGESSQRDVLLNVDLAERFDGPAQKLTPMGGVHNQIPMTTKDEERR